MRLSAMQNILVLNVPDAQVEELVVAAGEGGLTVGGSPFQRGTVSCTGSEYCKLAITETKQFSLRLAGELEERLPGFTDAIKLHVTGCPNACGQHWIADVGLQGVLLKQGGVEVEGFDVFVGGGLGARSGLAHRVAFRAPADDVPDALERLFVAFSAQRDAGETFRSWSVRVGDGAVKSALAGAVS
jgi:sulfite reductase (ferredoxin)